MNRLSEMAAEAGERLQATLLMGFFTKIVYDPLV